MFFSVLRRCYFWKEAVILAPKRTVLCYFCSVFFLPFTSGSFGSGLEFCHLIWKTFKKHLCSLHELLWTEAKALANPSKNVKPLLKRQTFIWSSGGGFKYQISFEIFTPIGGNDPFWLATYLFKFLQGAFQPTNHRVCSLGGSLAKKGTVLRFICRWGLKMLTSICWTSMSWSSITWRTIGWRTAVTTLGFLSGWLVKNGASVSLQCWISELKNELKERFFWKKHGLILVLDNSGSPKKVRLMTRVSFKSIVSMLLKNNKKQLCCTT